MSTRRDKSGHFATTTNGVTFLILLNFSTAAKISGLSANPYL
jgi:hypothetical protein